jgi:hypothetical protein
MLLQGKPLLDIDENDLNNLIGTKEDRKTDFKSAAYPSYPSDKHAWKAELCADIASFANAVGGWIICGMKEQKGIATEVCGLGENINVERELLRLEQTANSGIEPIIPGLHFHSIDLTDDNKAIIIHIPRSFAAPHKVNATSKFHIRRSMGKDEMDIDELRRAFNLSGQIIQRIREFRKMRVEAIRTRNYEIVPVDLKPGPLFILHIVPMTFVDAGALIDISAFDFQYPARWLLYNDIRTQTSRFNFEGFVAPLRNDSYVQVFRSGVIEIVEGLSIAKHLNTESIVAIDIVQIINGELPKSLAIQRNLGIELPLIILPSIVGSKDYHTQITEGCA